MRALLLIAFLLAGCAGGGSPLPPITPIPPAAPPPAPPVLVADWTPPLQATAICSDIPNPFHCSGPPDAKWGLLQAIDAPQFSPSPGALGFATRPNDGMALISTTVLDRTQPVSVELEVRVDTIDCNSGVAFVGGGPYGGGADDGDKSGRYRMLYISCFAGDTKVRLWLYSPTYAGAIWDFDFRDGQTHKLRLDWYPDVRVDYFLDDAMVFQETTSFGHDPLDIPHNLNPAAWFGSVTGVIFKMIAYGTLTAQAVSP